MTTIYSYNCTLTAGWSVARQEHLVVMGVPAFPHLAKGTPFPPFSLDSLTSTSLKRLAGNDAWVCLALFPCLLNYPTMVADCMWLHATQWKWFYRLVANAGYHEKQSQGMHECVCGSVWACALASWQSSDTEPISLAIVKFRPEPEPYGLRPDEPSSSATASVAHAHATPDSWAGFCWPDYVP